MLCWPMGDGGKFQDNLFIFYAIQSGDANGSDIICLPLKTKLYLFMNNSTYA